MEYCYKTKKRNAVYSVSLFVSFTMNRPSEEREIGTSALHVRRIRRLVVLCLYFKEALWVSANWAYFGGFLAYNDVSTLAALPDC